jgi:hypothetical protein
VAVLRCPALVVALQCPALVVALRCPALVVALQCPALVSLEHPVAVGRKAIRGWEVVVELQDPR